MDTDRNPEAKACSRKKGPDCKYLKAALSWWCINEESKKLRGTSIPGVVGCPFYKPKSSVGNWFRGFCP